MTERETLRPGGMELTRRMLESANFPPGARLFDVCCGGGATVEMLLNAGFDAAGIDLDPGDFDPATDHLPVIRGSAYDLPCRDTSLDGIFCECGFSSLAPDAALCEFARALKAGGALLLSDLYSRAERAGKARAGNLRVHTRENFESLLTSHGFELRRFEDHSDALRAFLARQIMECGGDRFCEKFRLDISRMRPLKCGYCFLLAYKR